MQEILIVNGRVHTMSPLGTLPGVAVALRAGRVVGVGPEEAMRRLLGRSVLRVDAQGGSVLPGFTDAHIHLTAFAQQPIHGPGRGVIESGDAANALREWLVRHAGPF